MIQFSESSRKGLIDQLLDLYNRYMELYHMSGDIQFKLEAEMIMITLHKHFSAKKLEHIEENAGE